MNTPGTTHFTQGNAGVGIRRFFALAPTNVGAGFGGSGTFVDGSAVDRAGGNAGGVALSVCPSVPARCVLASGNTVTFNRVIQHRINSSDAWADYHTQPNDVVVRGNNDGSAIELDLGDPNGANETTGLVTGAKWDSDLSGAKAQVRIRIKPTLSASGTDTVKFAGSVALTGYDVVPPAGI